jgi:nicotinate-nucleotide adenylyltransferase
MRVGVFGGSFDPAHTGHTHVAETARVRLGLHRVIWLVSPQNPLKPNAAAPLAERMRSARAHAPGPAHLVSDAETRMGSRFTLDTVRLLQARHPGVSFVWIMGGDNLATFHRWRGWVQIARAVPIAVVSRPGGDSGDLLAGRFSPAARRFAHRRLAPGAGRVLPKTPAPAWIYLEAPLHSASSTALREAAP